jgi:Lon protease-like protein
VSEHLGPPPHLVPLFPLPEVVLLPWQMLPLHIFEPRYREMTAAALAGGKHIAVAMLRPGYETTYFTNHAPIFDVVGLGKIVAAERVADGKFNLLLRGVGRFRVAGEQHGLAYRVAQLDPLCDRKPVDGSRTCELRHALRSMLECVPGSHELKSSLLRLFDSQAELGELVDRVAGVTPLTPDLRQRLLGEADVCCRAGGLIEALRGLAPANLSGPPKSPPCTRWELN